MFYVSPFIPRLLFRPKKGNENKRRGESWANTTAIK